MTGPDPNDKYPVAGFPQVCFIRNTVKNPNIVIGEYSYCDDPEDSEGFERNVLYHFPFIGDKLIIGKFCAIARHVRFIMNGANHKLSGISSHGGSLRLYKYTQAPAVCEQATSRTPGPLFRMVWNYRVARTRLHRAPARPLLNCEPLVRPNDTPT